MAMIIASIPFWLFAFGGTGLVWFWLIAWGIGKYEPSDRLAFCVGMVVLQFISACMGAAAAAMIGGAS